MDIYSSPKIKTTVKTVGSLIIIIFYSSLVDFYYIGPYIHNILSEIKFLANTNAVTAKSVQKIFLEINAMMFDGISFFNGFNRSVTKDMKLLLSEDVILNERIFLNLRGVPNSKEIMNMCRDYSGGKKYKELIESETIKPKVKSDVRVIEQPKYGDEIKVEQNDTGMFKFFKFKNKVKKNLFLDEEIDINEFSEYKNDYEKSIQKLKYLNSEGESYEKKEENDILEVFDFINNVTNTDKDNQAKIEDLTFWTDAENTENSIPSNNEEELTFGFDFNFDDKDAPNKKQEEYKKNENKIKKEKEKIDSFFDFKKNQSNMNNSSNKLKKVENKNINVNENKENKGKEGDILIDFDFPDDKKIENERKDEKKITKTKSNELANKNKNNNNSNNNLFDFNKFNSSNLANSNNNKNISNNNSKISQSTKINNNDSKKINEDKNVNQLIDMFDFSNDNSKKDEKAKISKKNNTLIEDDKSSETKNNQNNNKNDNLFNFDNFKTISNNKNINSTNNKNPNGFDFSSLNKGNTINNNLQNQNNLVKNVNTIEDMTFKKADSSINLKSNNNNNVFDFTKANFTNPKSNTSIQKQKKDNLNNNQNINNKNDNLNDLLSNFNFGNNQSKSTDMTQYIPSFPNNNNINNNTNNFNFNQSNNSSNFNFANFDYNNYNNQLALFQQNDEEINIELKEQICFYYKFKSGNKIVNAINQGYLGLTCEKEINKSKDFNITFKSQKFKNQQYIQKNFDKKLVKLDDLNYKVHFNNLKKSEKLLEYIINPNILAQNRILEPFIGGKNNVLNFGFMYNNSVKKEIQKIDLNIIYKNMITNNNMIKSDGNITNNNNNQIIVSYNGKINEAKIIYPININVFALVSKITITVNLEKDILSEVDVEIKDIEKQILLNAKKNTQINYEFS